MFKFCRIEFINLCVNRAWEDWISDHLWVPINPSLIEVIYLMSYVPSVNYFTWATGSLWMLHHHIRGRECVMWCGYFIVTVKTIVRKFKRRQKSIMLHIYQAYAKKLKLKKSKSSRHLPTCITNLICWKVKTKPNYCCGIVVWVYGSILPKK